MIITPRNRTTTTRTDLASVTLTVLTCAVFFLGLTALTGSFSTAATGAIGLCGAVVLAMKMMALPNDSM
ncbi:hypothetical protein AB0L82_36475 [Nocardia sp. NPDC052001]|uniref:hypothetical protein n=1 Tax=Nocardia sp. NPDC052001 TaxID=3154853 RepID=UPI0034465385